MKVGKGGGEKNEECFLYTEGAAGAVSMCVSHTRSPRRSFRSKRPAQQFHRLGSAVGSHSLSPAACLLLSRRRRLPSDS